LDLVAAGSSAVIALSFRLFQGTFAMELSVELDRPVTALFGPSGAGKTTVLDAIAGLRTPASGSITINDRVLFDSTAAIDVPTHKRHIGYVAQDVALFPHMSVRRNVLYGRRNGQKLLLTTVARMLEIETLLDRNVPQLSGGERQRVALARALMSAPELLLLDEPLAAVDVERRRRILPYLERVRDELKVPIVYVTHDRAEAAQLADEVVILDQGRIVERQRSVTDSSGNGGSA
jgi:molybdate transport system ATP-binding protein